jgi:aminodeoxyfutalosine deaminase
MSPFTLRARWVLPIDRPPIEGGYVAIADGRIVEASARDPNLGPIIDLSDAALLPGLLNAHTHLEFSALPRPLGHAGMALTDWIRLVIADRKRVDQNAVAAIQAGLCECLAAGVTTVGEIATSPAELYEAGDLRSQIVSLQEAIGFSAGRVDSVFADLTQRLDAAPPPRGLSPHAPYTVHPELLRKVVALASACRVPVAMHLAESLEELQLLANGDGPFRDLLEERSMWDAGAIPIGARPMAYLQMLAKAPQSLVIHGNYLAADEIQFLAAHRDAMSVVYCPRTHDYFYHAPYPLEAMLNAGVRVALGTDSRASNPDLNLWSELRSVAERFPSIQPATIFQMATTSGAAALGLEDVGVIAAGKCADIVAMPCATSYSDDPYEALLACASEPIGVWLAGERITMRPDTS